MIFDRKYPELLPWFCYQGTLSSLVRTGGLPRVANPRVLHRGDEFAVPSSLLAPVGSVIPRSPPAVSTKPDFADVGLTLASLGSTKSQNKRINRYLVPIPYTHAKDVGKARRTPADEIISDGYLCEERERSDNRTSTLASR